MVRTKMAAIAVALVALFAVGTGSANAYVSPGEAQGAAELGASWFESTQSENGALAGALGGGERFGEWSLTALAAGDVNAADAAPSLTGPTAQSYYDEFWVNRGPGSVSCPPGKDNAEICELQPDGVPTDAARSALSAVAGGLQPSRLSENRDFVSRLAFWWDGEQLGYRDLLNDDIFAILALSHSGAPRELLEQLARKVRSEQLGDGGWHWRVGLKKTNPNAASDTDMTASAIGALCAAGADPDTDPAIADGLALLEQRQPAASGGFSTSTSASAVNTNSTAWVVSGLNACGIDPQSGPWVKSGNTTPLDFLVNMQNADGSFRYMPANPAGSANLMASYQAVSPLGGNDWSGEAPERENAGAPAVKPAPKIVKGTEVPLTLVIDHGAATAAADQVRMCRVEVSQGDDLSAVLESAGAASAPGNCVRGASVSGTADSESVAALNGGTGEWTVSVNGSAEAGATGAEFGLGDMVVLRYRGDDALTPAAVVPVPQIEGKIKPDPEPDPDPDPEPIPGTYPKAKVAGKPALRNGRVRTVIACPAGSGAIGCNTTVNFGVRGPRAKRFRGFAVTAIQMPSGQRRTVRVKAGDKVRAALKSSARRGGKGRARIRVIAGTRAPDGLISYAIGAGTVRGQ
ncbi:MAG TPA: prenyltransferase/squalene oxidase repeat-containing protein [Solirubrobacterales bacterium]|nr:prenyltransferase/squalene oxidase repeat-containing protein [Solirubrobacterales bacterium]